MTYRLCLTFLYLQIVIKLSRSSFESNGDEHASVCIKDESFSLLVKL